MSVRVEMDWPAIEFELSAPAGMVQRHMLQIVRAIRFFARAETPVSSGHMRASWTHTKVAKVVGTKLTWKVKNTADYSRARITGVKPITTTEKMMVGATQRYGNPRPGPNRGITPSFYRDGYPGIPIFDLALDVVWVREGL